MSKDKLINGYIEILKDETKKFKKMRLNAKYGKYITHIKK